MTHAPADDPFDLLRLEPRFDLDPARVERAYLAQAAACHPDTAGSDPEAAAEAARQSALLNQARSALLDPERRARALLSRLGGPPGEPNELPEGFLAEIMETRMAIEQAIAEDDQDELDRWRAWGRERRRETMDRVSALFEAAGAADPADRAEALGEVQRRLNAWRYIERMLEQTSE